MTNKIYNSLITIVGGVYQEFCMNPKSFEVFGSGGRAASAIAKLGSEVHLHTYVGKDTEDAIATKSMLESFSLHPTEIKQGVIFKYVHGLDEPKIYNTRQRNPEIVVTANNIVRFGFIEGDAVVHADRAVYDPQNPILPIGFHANGSTAKHLALVLNRFEALSLCGDSSLSPEDAARKLAQTEGAEIVIIKLGAAGALIYENQSIETVPAFLTKQVWKIGSGDTFVAHFAYQWMVGHKSAKESAYLASLATAFYCENKLLPTLKQIEEFSPRPISLNADVNTSVPKVYLAGPFFTLSQLWIVEQARKNLTEMGLTVFSPYHDVGLGSADQVVQHDIDAINNCSVLFAIVDSLDPGTIFEIGYARAKDIPVIIYCENETPEDLKMMEGTNCTICKDYVTAIYKTLWSLVAK